MLEKQILNWEKNKHKSSEITKKKSISITIKLIFLQILIFYLFFVFIKSKFI